MDIKLVKQTLNNNCVSACLAMLTNIDVELVTDEFHADFQQHQANIQTYAATKGLILNRTVNRERLEPFGLYLLIVPSLNNVAMFHEVIVDYRDPESPKLYDPSRHQQYALQAEAPGFTDLASWIIDYKVIEAPALEYKEGDHNGSCCK